MDVSDIVIPGDTPGTEWRVPVLRFTGRDPAAPNVYIQAALHAGELPGTALLHFLCERLRRAETETAILGDITVVPQANPPGAAQWHFGEMQGRFDLGLRTNYNRDFPLIALDDRHDLMREPERYGAVERLKRSLLHMALSADLVLDLHCDDESLQYAYIDEAFWPEAADLAAALEMDAVFLSDGESSAFEEAVGHAWKHDDDGHKKTRLPGRLAATVELRGTRDVYPGLAAQDAAGIWNFLAGRGVVSPANEPATVYSGEAAPLDNIEMIKALEPGTVLFHRDVGDRVEAGDLLATLLTAPGMENGAVDIHAPQAGLIVTRTSDRFVRRHGSLMKILCAGRTKDKRSPGALED